jgi:hypothetical protein
MKKKTSEEKALLRKQWVEANKKRIQEYRKQYYANNKEQSYSKTKEWRDKNKDHLKNYRKNDITKTIKKRYNEKNKNKIREYNNSYNKKRKLSDPLYKLKTGLRSRISNLIKRNGFKRISKTQEILGCSFIEFKLHLESKFESWMNWDNHGLYNGELNYGWDIDHIIPLASANTIDELLKLNHYSNLQPLCSKVNRDIKINL